MGQLSLQDVFGVPPLNKSHSYVDRGGLDARLRYAASTQRLVIIHGDSKQGKTWLRQHILPADECVNVQCQVGDTPASLLTQALGLLGIKAEIRQTAKRDLQGTIDLAGSGEIGLHLISKFKVAAKLGGKAGTSTQAELAPVGQAPGDLAWVARVLVAAGRRLVIEDFHYLDEQSRKDFAFLLKAFIDYGVFPIIIGVWSQDHLLTYYNGDLSQRVEDIHLVWKPDELEAVLRQGSSALNVAMSSTLRRELVFDAYGNVGTLQALAEELCKQEGIFTRQATQRYLVSGPALTTARAKIALDMHQRFQRFAEAYVAGMRGLPTDQSSVLQSVIEAVCERPDDELVHGFPADDLEIACDNPPGRARLLEMLGRVDAFQAGLEISPLVMTFNKHAQTICLIDRRFLFYRRYGAPRWPWFETV